MKRLALGLLLAPCLLLWARRATPTGAVKTACIPLKTWTPAQEQQLATAIGALPADSPIVAMGDDWARMRADARACQVAAP